MARRGTRRSSSNRGSGRRTYSGRGRVSGRSARSVRSRAATGRSGRGQTVRLVLAFDPSAGGQGAYKPGVPGTVGVAAVPPGNGKAKF